MVDFKGGCSAIVAVKARPYCKSRLTGKLDPDTRVRLVRLMLNGVLGALREARSIGRIMVVSPERDTVPAEVDVLQDPGTGLNPALDATRRGLMAEGARELVILPADLPLISAEDIDLLVARGRHLGFALAPDVAGTGTNALYIGSAERFQFQFGPNSRFLHVAEAARLGLGSEVLRLRGLEFDLDGPEDLDRLIAHKLMRYESLSLARAVALAC